MILSILPVKSPRILIAVKQEHWDSLEGHEDKPITLRLNGYPGSIAATLDRVEKRASTAVPHAALASTGGGPLLVRQRSQISGDTNRGLAYQRGGMPESPFSGLGDDDPTLAVANQELTRARFAAYAVLDLPEIAGALREGQWGFVKLANVREERLGAWLYQKLSLYVRRKWEQANSM